MSDLINQACAKVFQVLTVFLDENQAILISVYTASPRDNLANFGEPQKHFKEEKNKDIRYRLFQSARTVSLAAEGGGVRHTAQRWGEDHVRLRQCSVLSAQCSVLSAHFSLSTVDTQICCMTQQGTWPVQDNKNKAEDKQKKRIEGKTFGNQTIQHVIDWAGRVTDAWMKVAGCFTVMHSSACLLLLSNARICSDSFVVALLMPLQGVYRHVGSDKVCNFIFLYNEAASGEKTDQNQIAQIDVVESLKFPKLFSSPSLIRFSRNFQTVSSTSVVV